jgi:hypothetical protein
MEQLAFSSQRHTDNDPVVDGCSRPKEQRSSSDLVVNDLSKPSDEIGVFFES